MECLSRHAECLGDVDTMIESLNPFEYHVGMSIYIYQSAVRGLDIYNKIYDAQNVVKPDIWN